MGRWRYHHFLQDTNSVASLYSHREPLYEVRGFFPFPWLVPKSLSHLPDKWHSLGTRDTRSLHGDWDKVMRMKQVVVLIVTNVKHSLYCMWFKVLSSIPFLQCFWTRYISAFFLLFSFCRWDLIPSSFPELTAMTKISASPTRRLKWFGKEAQILRTSRTYSRVCFGVTILLRRDSVSTGSAPTQRYM